MSAKGFTLVEILIAVAVLTTVMLGTSALISTGGKQASRLEDDRELSDLLLSAKNCVGTFPVPYLRSVPTNSKVTVSFGTGNLDCMTGATFTGSRFPENGTGRIVLGGKSGETEAGERSFAAFFSVKTSELPTTAVKTTVTVTDDSISKSLEWRMDQ